MYLKSRYTNYYLIGTYTEDRTRHERLREKQRYPNTYIEAIDIIEQQSAFQKKWKDVESLQEKIGDLKELIAFQEMAKQLQEISKNACAGTVNADLDKLLRDYNNFAESVFQTPSEFEKLIREINEWIKHLEDLPLGSIKSSGKNRPFILQPWRDNYKTALRKCRDMQEEYEVAEVVLSTMRTVKAAKLYAEIPFILQNVEGCLRDADIFINNETDNERLILLKKKLLRYVSLIMNPGLVLPTPIERGMQIAYTAKLNSGCISRQVGAAITDDQYHLLSVGWNQQPEMQLPCLYRDLCSLYYQWAPDAYSDFELDNQNTLQKNIQDPVTNAFETLYSKHDATKSGFRRELRSELSYDNFKKVFAQFCFITYYQAKIELTYDDIVTVLNKIKGSNGITIFRPEDYLYDLVNSICVLYREGVTYKFTHRSFQEYFSAIFLKELSDQNMEKMGISLVKKDYFRASHDSVFFMLRDMAEQRFEQNILLPFVVEFETTCSDTDKYDFYFEELSPEIFFDEVDFDGEIHLVICADFNVEAVGFIYAMARHYRDTTSSHVKQLKDAEDELRNFLISERDYKIEEKVDLTEYRDDSKLYSLLKATWIGDYLTVMANLREMLEHRRRKEEQDLFELLDE